MNGTAFRRPPFAVWLIVATFAGGCGEDEPILASPVPQALDMPPSEGPFETTAAEDLNPAAGIVEVRLEAQLADVQIAPGYVVPMWTYNGLLPGPRIEANVGDTVIVHLTNSLPQETTIHWHGLRVPAEMDGVPVIQAPIRTGETFTYQFTVPDAGTFWYHPHIYSHEQVERGLYGAIVVRGPSEPVATSDRVIVLDDILLDEAGQLAPFTVGDAHMGRQGNVILVNGRAHPIADVQPGGLHRFRFVNAANARYFNLQWPGRTFTVIGEDAGLLETPRQVANLLLVPGDRVDVVVHADGQSGELSSIVTMPYERGHGTIIDPQATVFDVRHSTEPRATPPTLPAALGTVPTLPNPIQQQLVTMEEEPHDHGSHNHGGHVGQGNPSDAMFSMNGAAFGAHTALAAAAGTVEEWSLLNLTNMDHPFHLHGYRFQVAEVNGAPPEFRAWEDTINVPANATVRILADFDGRPGRWMFHCHILEHGELGMMGEVVVSPEN